MKKIEQHFTFHFAILSSFVIFDGFEIYEIVIIHNLLCYFEHAPFFGMVPALSVNLEGNFHSAKLHSSI